MCIDFIKGSQNLVNRSAHILARANIQGDEEIPLTEESPSSPPDGNCLAKACKFGIYAGFVLGGLACIGGGATVLAGKNLKDYTIETNGLITLIWGAAGIVIDIIVVVTSICSEKCLQPANT